MALSYLNKNYDVDAHRYANENLQFFDRNFNLVSELQTSAYILNYGYINGKYFYHTLYDGTYLSDDMVNWYKGNVEDIEYDEDDIKRYNRNENIFFDSDKTMSFDGKTFYEIAFEKPHGYINMSDKYIIRGETSTYLLISKDDIYYIPLYVNDMVESDQKIYFGRTLAVGDYLYIDVTEDTDGQKSTIARVKIPLSEIDAELDAMENAPYVVYDNKILAFEQPPVIQDDRTLIPIRFLFEQMGATVDWDSETRTAAISQNDRTITFSIDNTIATVNGQPAQMDVPARLINEKTMVPLRFLSENLGYTVDWDGENRIITIE